MIRSFANQTAVDLFRGRNTRHARLLPRDGHAYEVGIEDYQ